MKNNNFWSSKSVLITGINGFIGGHIAEALLARGAKITGLMRNMKRDTYLFFEGMDRRINLVSGDLTDHETLQRVVSEEQIQVCFHLGAQVEVGVARRFPYLTWETNIRGTYCLLEALREQKDMVEAIVVASSDKAYGSYPASQMPYREYYPLKPVFPYDVSKACADMIAQSYASDLFQLPLVITRFCNIYGPGQLNFSALIPDSIRAALGFGEFVPRSDGKHVRDFIFAQDAAELYLIIAEALSRDRKLSGQIFNAGTNQPKAVDDIVRMVYEIAGALGKYQKVEEAFQGKKTTGEIDIQFMSFDKLNEYFGWEPKTEFRDGLKKTVQWYRNYLNAQSLGSI